MFQVSSQDIFYIRWLNYFFFIIFSSNLEALAKFFNKFIQLFYFLFKKFPI